MMKNVKRVVLALGALSLGMMAASTAAADMGAGPSASATIDWSTFKICFYDYETQPTYTMDGQNQYGYTSINTSGNGWGVVSSSGSMFTLSDSEISSFASLSLGELNSVNSSVNRSANLEISGAGLLVVSANYSWDIDLVEQSGTQNASVGLSMSLSGDNSQSSSGNVNAFRSYPSYNFGYYDNVYVADPMNSVTINAPVTAPLFINNSNQLSDDGTGKLSASLYVTNGMNVHLSASAFTSVSASQPYSPVNPASPVPVPAAAWLLGSGVFGLLAAKRKRQA